MIERCLYCGETHDVGDGDTLNGMVIKTCPKHPEDPMFTFIDKKAFNKFRTRRIVQELPADAVLVEVTEIKDGIVTLVCGQTTKSGMSENK